MTFAGRPSAGDGETIGELFSRLAGSGKRFVRAEIDFYKKMAIARVAGFQTAAILVVVALFLVQASLTTLLIGIGLGIARVFSAIGTPLGVIIAAVLGLIVSGLLVRFAVSRAKSAAGADLRRSER